MTRAHYVGRTAHGHGLRERAAARTRDVNLAGRRAEWRELADKARSAAQLSGAAQDEGFARDLAHLAARAAKAPAPLEGEADRLAAEALRLLAQVWARKSPPPSELTEALGAAARLVDQGPRLQLQLFQGPVAI